MNIWRSCTKFCFLATTARSSYLGDKPK